MTIPEIEKYIEERLLKKLSAEVATLETDDDQANMEIEDDTLTPTSDHQEDEEENQKIKELFLKSLQEYGAKVATLNDPNTIRAMKAMTKTLRKSMQCNPHTIQNQLHTFGKGGAAARKSK